MKSSGIFVYNGYTTVGWVDLGDPNNKFNKISVTLIHKLEVGV